MNCLIVDDDICLAEQIRRGLAGFFRSIDIVNGGYEALEKLMNVSYDLVVTDLMLPGLSGSDILAKIKKNHTTPTIVISARGDCVTRAEALQGGADDFIMKPFSLAELQIRVQRIIGRSGETDLVMSSGDLILNRVERKATVRGGQAIELSDREFMLLELLIKNPTKILSKDLILKEVWNYDFNPQTNVVDVMICRLRQKLDDESQKMIRTYRGQGYALNAV
ncbi:MAG: response regulator transcription factor [Bdellovibrio sp.]|nr:response regulator transcription factor [Bdellovibrio sp.]